jgi:hypothetical protein
MRNTIPVEELNLFSPDVIESMGLAFEAAWTSLVEAGSVAAAPFRADQTRESLALFIIAKVRAGDYDEVRLRNDALEHVLHHIQPPAPRASEHAALAS